MANGVIIGGRDVMYKTYTWNNVNITSLSGGIYYTSGDSNKFNAKIDGYNILGVTLLDWVNTSGFFGLYTYQERIGAYSPISQTIDALVIQVAYVKA